LKGLVVAIGNPFMKDDGVGQAVLGELRKRPIEATLLDLGTDIMRLSLHGDGYDVIVIVDSLRGAGEPGKVMSFDEAGMVRDLESNIRSAHLMGSIEAIQVLREIRPSLARARFHFVGVVVKEISVGEGLSPAVGSAVPEAVDAVLSALDAG
jgi:hydrogenase maturation protease